MGVYIKARFNYDPDALAFIQASSIPNTSQKLAVNQLVLDLKAYGLWSKMKAIYPMVGGSAFYHKWNLKDPRDLDAAFRLNFVGGWTHSSTGALPNGTNGYANTFLDSANNLSLNDGHFSYYSRTNNTSSSIDMGSLKSSPDSYSDLVLHYTGLTYFRLNNMATYDSTASSTTLGFFTGSRTASNIIKAYRNGSVILNGVAPSNATSSADFFIGAVNSHGVGSTDTGAYFSNRECAFASIGTSLNNTEAANFYTAVQNFQIALGRSIGTQTVSDADAQAFINAAVIEDQIQANAINQLVTDMKGYGIWSKMKAVYPFVGGTAASHKWNLKNPLDTNAAFRLTFYGGWTHSSTGAKGNGTNAWAATYLIPNTHLTNNSTHVNYYSRTNSAEDGTAIGGIAGDAPNYSRIAMWIRWSTNQFFSDQYNDSTNRITVANTDSRGLFTSNRTASNLFKAYRNGSVIGTNTNASINLTNANQYLALNAYYQVGNALLYSARECAFASIGDGLTDTEAANFYTVVQNFNTALNRQVV